MRIGLGWVDLAGPQWVAISPSDLLARVERRADGGVRLHCVMDTGTHAPAWWRWFDGEKLGPPADPYLRGQHYADRPALRRAGGGS